MANFGETLKKLRKQSRLTQQELATRANLSLSRIAKCEAEAIPHIKGSTYRLIASALGMTAEELDFAWRNPHAPSQHRVAQKGVPVINRTTAGAPSDYQDVGRDNYSHLPLYAESLGDPDAFAIEIVGDSMMPEWQSGDTIICSPRAKAKSGDPCFIQLDGQGNDGNSFKRVFELPDGRVELRPDNPRYAPLIVERERLMRCIKVIMKIVRYK
jgi:SOS-response transcriptional repressor LexA